MLSLPPPTPGQSKPKRTTPNILPTSIKHNGPIQIPRRYWSPTTTSSSNPEAGAGAGAGAGKETKTAHFRGRRLQGRTVRVPENYTGVVLHKSSTQPQPLPRGDENEDDEMEEVPETRALETQATFEEVVVWGHERVPEGEEDVYVKGVEEWVGFAEAMHSYGEPAARKET